MTRMKESGIDWIGQIPEEWEIVKFKYLFNTSKGLSITKEHLVDEGIPVINYGQIHSSLTKQVQSCDVRLPFVANYYLSKKGVKLNQGDFVFADTSEDLEGAGNFSTRLDSTGQLLAGYHTIIARLNDYDEHDFRYFMHLFDSLAIRKQIQNKVSGVKVYSVTQGILNSIFVIIPPKSEQQKIADFLDKKTAQLDKVKSLLEEQIQKLKDYRASLIYETVTKGLDKTVPMKDSGIDWIGQVPEGWGVKRLKDYVDFQTGTTPPNSIGVNQEGKGIRWFKPGDFSDESIDLTSAENYITSEIVNQKKLSVYPEKIILVVGVASIGKVGYSENSSYSNQQITALKVIGQIFPKYLAYFMFSSGQYIRETALYTVVPIINNQYLSSLKIILPNLEEQESIVEYLDRQIMQINKMITIKNQQIENINKQRQTLIYDYVTGKRRV
ncbi:restriction endonuclease subunit S [Streptococcus thermophilus]|uniref:restriction endonuclease subunit S n=1 Tax=Streptococcus thermophilus TaxID=1308 RepID=UPI002632A882|nr:restriction endonuclease subunit S [Streptococcus thermophilus]